MSEISPELYKKMEDYLARVKDFIARAGKDLTLEQRQRIEHLVDHSEAPEGLLELSWILEERDGSVPPELALEILDLTRGFILREHYPPSIRATIDE